MQLKGKQIKDSSVEQGKLNVTTESITNISAVTNAEYVNQNSVDRVEAITYATLNMNMLANNATVGSLACDTQVIEFPISNIMVKINNVNVTVGATADCYFSPDGVIIRTGGQAIKGDYLYWNSTRFDLDNTDEIDFIYLTASDAVKLTANDTVVLDPYYPALNIKYTGADDTNMIMIIDGVSFTTGNVAGDFVWDIGGANETTLTTVGDNVIQDVNGEDYTIWFDGFGLLLFSLKKGNFSPTPSYAIINYGYLYNSFVVTDVRNINNTGWRVSTKQDWDDLNTWLINSYPAIISAPVTLAIKDTLTWNNITGTPITNELGMNIKAGGYGHPPLYQGETEQVYYRTTDDGFFDKYSVVITNYDIAMYDNFRNELIDRGESIRLVKESTTLTHGQSGTYVGNDGKLYHTICIGTQEWLAENLAETKYRNGDTIPELLTQTEWDNSTTASEGARCYYDNNPSKI